MRKLFALILVACLLLAMCACGTKKETPAAADDTPSPGNEEVEVIKIGVAAPVSGENAAGGKMLTTPVKLFG